MGYKKISIRGDVYERLVKLRERLGFTSVSDVIAYLLIAEDLRATISSMFEKHYATLSSMLERELATISSMLKGQHATDSSMASEPHATQGSMETKQHATKGSKRSAIEVLKDQKVTCLSDLARAGKKSPEAIIESARRGGAIIIRTSEDTCAVEPEFWGEFRSKLNAIKTPDDREVLSKLKDSRMKKLFQLLRKAGALYLDNKSGSWVYDYAFIEEPPKAEPGEVEVEEFE